MKALRFALIAVALLLLAPLLLVRVFDLYHSAQRFTQEADTSGPEATPASGDCIRTRRRRPSAWDVGEEKYRQFIADWVATCEREAVADSSPAGQLSLSDALFAADRRPEAVAVLRALAATGNADALVEIYQWHRSWEKRDLDRAQIVTAKEASESLRRAAQAGHPRAMHVYAIDLEQGRFVKRDVDAAAHWMEQSLARPSTNAIPADLKVSVGRLLTQSADPGRRARGIRILESMNRPDAKGYLAVAIRNDDPVRARALFEDTLRAWPGISLPPLADMLIKGEGGPADGTRALKLLQRYSNMSAPASINEALGRLYADGKLLPRDPQKAADLMSGETQWSVMAKIAFAQFLADNPTVKAHDPRRVLYEITKAAELGERGALAALIALKLSSNPPFAEKAAGCRLAHHAAKSGDASATIFLAACT